MTTSLCELCNSFPELCNTCLLADKQLYIQKSIRILNQNKNYYNQLK
jgi:hypothetical protein